MARTLTDAQVQALLDEAVAIAKTTTVGYAGHSAAWRSNTTTAWYKSLAKIAAARGGLDNVVVPPPPPPPPSGSNAPAAVIPPSPYSLPTNVASVRTSAELVSALAGTTRDIVLDDGVYDQATYFDCGGKRLYARHLGKAILKAGVVFGGNNPANAGGLLQGAVVDTVLAKTMSSSAVNLWGPGAKSFSLLDTIVRGNKSVAYGANGYSPQDSVWERCEFYGLTDVGLRLSDNDLASAITIKRVRDILVDGVTRAVVNSSNGTAEAGAWFGHKIVEGAQRIKVRNVSWSGIETVNCCFDTTLSDLDVDMSGIPTGSRVPLYMEHFSRGCTVERFLFKGANWYSIVGEWADPGWGSKPAAVDVTIRNGKMVGGKIGVYFDYGSGPGNSVYGCEFEGQTWAAIAAYQNVSPPIIGDGLLHPANVYKLAVGAKEYRTEHSSAAG